MRTYSHPLDLSRGAFSYSLSPLPSPLSPRAFTLIEVMVVLVVIATLTAFCIPSFQRALEQSRADVAVANLRAVWAAQRLYWLEYRTFAGGDNPDGDLPDPGIESLKNLELLGLDGELSSSRYKYYISAAGLNSFTVVAERTGAGSDKWSSSFTINENGVIDGEISASGESDITSTFQ